MTFNESGTQTASLAARYGEMSLPAAGPWNDVIAGLMQHRSVRGYKSDALPPGTLETLIAAAQSAATSSNMQTWSAVAITEPAKKATFARLSGHQGHIMQCPLFLVFLADLSRLARMGATEGKTLEGLPYFETYLVAAIDAALAAQNAVVAAESLGLSTVYIGAMRNDPEAVARELGLPEGCMAVFGLCIGYALPGHESAVKPRLGQAAVLHRERYDPTNDDTVRTTYDRAMLSFSTAHERQGYTWTERMMARVGRVSALNGRDRLADALRRLGFPLR
jgi:nitroreductase